MPSSRTLVGMKVSFELDEDRTKRLARQAQLERRSANNQAYFLFLRGLEVVEQEREAAEKLEPSAA